MARVERVVSNTLKIDRICLSVMMALHGSNTVTAATYGLSLRTRQSFETIEDLVSPCPANNYAQEFHFGVRS